MITVGYCSDINAQVGVAVSAASVLRYASKKVNFIFMLNEYYDQEENSLLRVLRNTGKPFTYEFRITTTEEKERIAFLRPSDFHKSREVFVRLTLPRIAYNQRILYLDADTVVTCDVAPLFELDMKDCALAAVQEDRPVGSIMDSKVYLDHGWKRGDKIFNTGVLLIESTLWRAYGYTEKIFGYIENSSQNCSCAINTPMNISIGKNYFPLASWWNADARIDLHGAKGICHYIGIPKPWNIFGTREPASDIWMLAYRYAFRKKWRAWLHLSEWKFVKSEWDFYKKIWKGKKIMMIWYVALEPYVSRYTLQLKDWTVAEYERLGVNYVVVPGQFPRQPQDHIKVGQALDAYIRPYFAMSQIQFLIECLRKNQISGDDWIYFEDMFHPGVESLFYILSFMAPNDRPRIGMKNQAQTIDPDDFTNYTGMAPWMREYEQMVLNFVDCIFINSPEMVNFAVAAGWREKTALALVGHTIHPKMVRDLLGEPVKQWVTREDRVIFASRLVHEKQPLFYKKVAEELWKDKMFRHVEFDILSGTAISVSPYAAELIQWVIKDERVHLEENLTKVAYYKILNRSKVMFNCAFQDWVSYVLLEASSLGMNVLFPAYRSFPSALNSNPSLLYIPWSVEDAVNKLKKQLIYYYEASEYPSVVNSTAVERTVCVMNAFTEYKQGGCDYLLMPTKSHQSGEQYGIKM